LLQQPVVFVGDERYGKLTSLIASLLLSQSCSACFGFPIPNSIFSPQQKKSLSALFKFAIRIDY
jgi:hypothetical protein